MIRVLSRIQFWSLLKNKGINDENVESIKNTFFISINSTNGSDSEPFFKEEHSNVLSLFFDDCDSYKKYPKIGSNGEFYVQIPMSESQALEVLDFIGKLNETSDVFVHCTAGISRSGAVGAFISDYFNNNWEKFMFDNPQVIPNSYISSLLRKTYYSKYPEIYKKF